MESEIKINTAVYDELGERWYTAQDDPIALLRAESNLRNPWIVDVLKLSSPGQTLRILDMGCGAGFLSGYLAKAGHEVTGLDLSEQSLTVARRYDSTRTVNYIQGDASQVPCGNGVYDVVTAMDFLEHVEDPLGLIREVSRILKPGGMFFFHTFNRNPIAGLLVIKGVEWFVKNTPKNLHLYKYFIKPSELQEYCNSANLSVVQFLGVKPRILSRAFLKVLWTGTVPPEFRFEFTSSLLVGYSGYAIKNSNLKQID